MDKDDFTVTFKKHKHDNVIYKINTHIIISEKKEMDKIMRLPNYIIALTHSQI